MMRTIHPVMMRAIQGRVQVTPTNILVLWKGKSRANIGIREGSWLMMPAIIHLTTVIWIRYSHCVMWLPVLSMLWCYVAVNKLTSSWLLLHVYYILKQMMSRIHQRRIVRFACVMLVSPHYNWCVISYFHWCLLNVLYLDFCVCVLTPYLVATQVNAHVLVQVDVHQL